MAAEGEAGTPTEQVPVVSPTKIFENPKRGARVRRIRRLVFTVAALLALPLFIGLFADAPVVRLLPGPVRESLEQLVPGPALVPTPVEIDPGPSGARMDGRQSETSPSTSSAPGAGRPSSEVSTAPVQSTNTTAGSPATTAPGRTETSQSPGSTAPGRTSTSRGTGGTQQSTTSTSRPSQGGGQGQGPPESRPSHGGGGNNRSESE